MSSGQMDRSIFLGNVAHGGGTPEGVTLYDIPDPPDYRYADVNGPTVLVNPNGRQIVYLYR
jgi:hypothetical protein